MYAVATDKGEMNSTYTAWICGSGCIAAADLGITGGLPAVKKWRFASSLLLPNERKSMKSSVTV